jgi:hypothetical protein
MTFVEWASISSKSLKRAGLARAWRPEAERIDRAGALQSRSYAEFEAIHLSFPVQEVLGQVI